MAVLLFLSLLLIMGMAMLASQALRYRGAVAAREGALALSLAEAGMEDARVKLQKDPDFPPPGAPEQKTFSYAEELLSPDGRPVGRYVVMLDALYAPPPHQVLRVRATGTVGERGQRGASRTIYGELDLARKLREDATQPNPRCHEWINWVVAP